ncbi:MAG: TIGR00730 family Rossman fold protein [Ruminococcaceae bacterium]|nr:TIGR00730 family Rossman fold protein [Oscillospiraceae bacterium]
MNICVYGAASPSIAPVFIEQGEALGREMVKRSHALVFGGGALGLMGAVARGVREGGGTIIGVVPRFFEHDAAETLFTACDEYIQTDTMRERKHIMEDRADAFVITPGGIGTFEEFLEILTLRQLCRHEKPIAIFNVDGYYDTLLAFLREAIDKGFLKATCLTLFCVTDDVQILLDYLEQTPQAGGSVQDYKEG